MKIEHFQCTLSMFSVYNFIKVHFGMFSAKFIFDGHFRISNL